MATCLPYKLAWVPIISICKKKAKTTSPTVRLPITADTVADIKRVLGKQPKTYHNTMIWQTLREFLANNQRLITIP